MSKKALVWIRRSLRASDHTALSYATNNFDEVYILFVFDKYILEKLDDKSDHRVTFIHDSLQKIKNDLGKLIYTVYGKPEEVVTDLAKSLDVDAVCTHNDYEPYAFKRDQKVRDKLASNDIDFKSFKDHVIFESHEVLTNDGEFYKVFTPYKNSWFKKLKDKKFELDEKQVDLKKITYKRIEGYTSELALSDFGFERCAKEKAWEVDPKSKIKSFLDTKIADYDDKRDFPEVEGTSKLSPYLRFGQVSVREVLRREWPLRSEGAKTWGSEIAWRDFYFGILKKHPRVEEYAYNKKYENIPWENNEDLFDKWTRGETGVPIVDAGMRQLNTYGWMHNRLRMITASYLTKILFIDWKWGERYFAKKLLDFDLAANNGGWQWSASTGCDAAPYFRVFNPYRQSERFDKEAKFIKRLCPELKDLPAKYIHDPTKITEKVSSEYKFNHGKDYPRPIANYSERRKEAIAIFKDAPYE